MKKVLVLMLLVMFLPALGIAEEPNNEPIGTRLNPYKALDEPKAQIDITAMDAVTFGDVDATVTIQLLGELKEAAGLEKINESNYPPLTGPSYFCYQFLITADKIMGDNPILIDSDMFKAFTYKFIQTDVITYLEDVTLLDGTSAYYYVGIHTPNTFPGYVVFDNRLWFYVSFCKLVETEHSLSSPSPNTTVSSKYNFENEQEMKKLQSRLEEIAYEVYGSAAKNNNVGVFQFSDRLDFDIVIWYRTDLVKTLFPFEQLYFDLFEYENLEQFFADPETNGLFFCYCYNLVGGDFDKVFMGTITRESFESIDLEFYDELWYFEYFDIREADKTLFPQFYY